MSDSQNVCQSPGCTKTASLRCPHCLKLGINSYYCSQDCFKKNYREHKKVHGPNVNIQSNTSTYCPWPNFTFTGRLRPYPTTPARTVPPNILRPDYADSPTGVSLSEMEESCTNVIKVLDAEEIEGMRVACKLAREVLDEAIKACAVGVTTDAIDNIVHEACIERECYPSPLNYYNFPKSCCTSINEIICHGIPDLRPLENGDICNLDITVYHRGYHGDVNETIFIGEVDPAAKHLVKTCYECLDKSIQLVKPGVKYRELGEVIQRHADQNGLSVVRSYCGHGIHKLFHCNPRVPHYARNRSVGVMRQGHVFTIEPMINEGTWRDVLWPDSWTAATQDGKRSAQFEHTLLVTENGCDILTARHNGIPWFMEQK